MMGKFLVSTEAAKAGVEWTVRRTQAKRLLLLDAANVPVVAVAVVEKDLGQVRARVAVTGRGKRDKAQMDRETSGGAEWRLMAGLLAKWRSDGVEGKETSRT